ncbi:MAG TPA: hypothetical protein HPP66_11265 [Planctomycetes bacterium]|nr:hypothetical protein [Planctomycetota bacterium]
MWRHIITILISLTMVQMAAGKNPTALELLGKYTETQDKLQSFIVKYEHTTYQASTSLSGRLPRLGKGQAGGFYEFRFDGKRRKKLDCMWGHVGMSPEFTPRDKAKYRSRLWDGETFFQYGGQEKHASFPFGSVTQITNFKDNIEEGRKTFCHAYLMLRGYFYGDYERVDSILRNADTISVRDDTQSIGASDCYVINAVTKHGKYTLWIDPEHGYNITKAIARKTRGDLNSHGLLKGKAKALFSMKNVRFKKIDGVWVPMEADTYCSKTWSKGEFWKSSGHTKRTEFILNPDHDALGSFLPDDIRDGAKIYSINGVRTRGYTWRNGGPVDESGRKVDYKSVKPKK